MAELSPIERAAERVNPVWLGLDAVRARDEALVQFLWEEVPVDAGDGLDALNLRMRLAAEFRDEIWPHRVPERVELTLAEMEGRLNEKVVELNAEFAAGK
jgi:hypothetical protein